MGIKIARIQFKCKNCSLAFYRRPKELKRPSDGKYCSMACRGSSMRTGRMVSCVECHKPFYRGGSELKRRGKDSFCSILCYKENRGRNIKGYRKVGQAHEHRIIAEKILGRKLRRGEVVHHIDGDKQNNKVSNIKILTRAEHGRIHGVELVKDKSRNNLGKFI